MEIYQISTQEDFLNVNNGGNNTYTKDQLT